MLSKVLKGAMSMKVVSNEIEQYDTELPLAISVLEIRAKISKPSLESDSQETSRDEGVYLVELERSREQNSNVLSSSKSEKEPLKSDSESPDDCARSDNEEKNSFGTGNEVCKFFAGMVCYIGMVESSIE